MYIYLYTENEYILDTLDIKYIQRTEPTFLFKTHYSDSPDKKELRFFFHQNLENSSVPHRTKHTKNGTYSQNTLTNKIDIFSPRSLLPLMGTVVFLECFLWRDSLFASGLCFGYAPAMEFDGITGV